MKTRTILLLFVAMLTQGCASYVSRHHWNENTRRGGTTAYFAGTVDDSVQIGKGLAAPFRQDCDWIHSATMPLFLIDLPLSMAADVLWIPSDFLFQRKVKKHAAGEEDNH
jgi:uncharacterized protein YceK